MTYIVQFTFYSCLILHQPGIYIYKTCFIWSSSKIHRPDLNMENFSVHDKFHRTLILSGFCLLKIAKISLNSSFFPKPIKR